MRKEPVESTTFDEGRFNEDECPQIREKIEQRGCLRLTNPEARINTNLIKEFYANVVREDKTKALTFKSYVRGTEVDFSPNAITRTLQLKSPYFDEPSYHVRISNAPTIVTTPVFEYARSFLKVRISPED